MTFGPYRLGLRLHGIMDCQDQAGVITLMMRIYLAYHHFLNFVSCVHLSCDMCTLGLLKCTCHTRARLHIHQSVSSRVSRAPVSADALGAEFAMCKKLKRGDPEAASAI